MIPEKITEQIDGLLAKSAWEWAPPWRYCSSPVATPSIMVLKTILPFYGLRPWRLDLPRLGTISQPSTGTDYAGIDMCFHLLSPFLSFSAVIAQVIGVLIGVQIDLRIFSPASGSSRPASD